MHGEHVVDFSASAPFEWTVSQDGSQFFVVERLGASTRATEYGPIPTRDEALRLVDERKAWARAVAERTKQDLAAVLRSIVEPGLPEASKMPRPREVAVSERIVAAACMIGEVVASMPPPNRHGDIMRHVTGRVVQPESQGFLTSAGRFADRQEAYRIAHRAGQVREKHDRTLYSEDLW